MTPTPRVAPLRLGAAVTAALLLLLAAAPLTAQRELTLPGLGQGELRESQLRQGATVVVVFASWSPRSRDVVSQVNQIQERWGARARVVMVSFQEDRETVASFLRGKETPVPVYLDTEGAFSKKHSVTTLPSLLVFKDGTAGFRGKLPADPDTVIAQVLG